MPSIRASARARARVAPWAPLPLPCVQAPDRAVKLTIYTPPTQKAKRITPWFLGDDYAETVQTQPRLNSVAWAYRPFVRPESKGRSKLTVQESDQRLRSEATVPGRVSDPPARGGHRCTRSAATRLTHSHTAGEGVYAAKSWDSCILPVGGGETLRARGFRQTGRSI